MTPFLSLQLQLNEAEALVNNNTTVTPTMNIRTPRPLMCLSAPSVGLIRGSPPRPQLPTPVNRVTPFSTQSTYIRMRQPPQQPMQYKSYTLKAQAKYSVFVSHVADGPLSFSLQLVETHPQLTSLMQKINAKSPEQVTAPIHAGMMCLARFAEDSSLCRALVMYTSANNTCRVYYVDYGNSEDVLFSDIFALPNEFAAPKVLSYRFVLSGLQGKTVTEEEKEVFKEVVDRMEAFVIVSAIDEASKKYVGDLSLNGRDVMALVKEKLMKKQPAAVGFPPSLWPGVGTKMKVFITSVGQSGKFFVQDVSYIQDLGTIMKSIQKYCTEGRAQRLKLEDKVVGMPCCAKYVDGMWYRARILEFCGDNVLILYVDFGNEDNVQFNYLLDIAPELVAQLEVRAIECLLREPNDNNARNKLVKLHGEIVTIEVIAHTEGGLLVNLLDSDGNDMMVQPPTTPIYQSPRNDSVGTETVMRDLEVEAPVWDRRPKRFTDPEECFPRKRCGDHRNSRRENFRKNDRKLSRSAEERGRSGRVHPFTRFS